MSHRRFEGGGLVVASHNPGKVREIKELLAPYSADILSAGDLNLPDPEETGTTFAANAELKAIAAAQLSGEIALSDDSGLVVSALNGAPGIYSARWAGPSKNFDIAIKRVEAQLAGSKDYSAKFVCALTLAWPDGHMETFEGAVFGAVSFPQRGGAGFGYDPIFVPDGYDLTFAQIDPQEKKGISHRADAFRKLVAACFS